VPFVGVTEVVHRLIVNAQYQLLEFSDRAHRAFTALSIEGASVQEVLDRASAMTREPVVLEDLAHRAVAYSAGPLEPAEVLRDWEARSRAAGPRAETTTTSPHGWLLTPVGPRFQRWGRLVMPRPAQDNPQLVMLLERAAEALALIRLVERDRAGLEQQAHGGLLADLVRSRTADRPAQRARAEALGFPLARHSFVGLCVASSTDDRLDPVVQESRDRTLAEAASAACRTAGLPALVSSLQPDHALVLVAVPRTRRAETAVEQVALALDADLRSRGEGRPTVGAGRVVESFDDGGASLSEARHVVDVMASSGARPDRVYYGVTDLGLRGLLASVRDDPRLVGFAESQLGPLLAYDARRGSSLEQTLRQYLEAGGNKSRLARTGHISRPALYARLATIESLLDVDLDDAEAAAGLLVALLIRSLRAAEGQPT
jgi:purine catabolism regulator